MRDLQQIRDDILARKGSLKAIRRILRVRRVVYVGCKIKIGHLNKQKPAPIEDYRATFANLNRARAALRNACKETKIILDEIQALKWEYAKTVSQLRREQYA